ncbi:unnamed protein product [Didymodactylos carnosus]|uniref:triacylglycerol lipase n=1 Tax=Didymodactylos carnosus TaxID=1234261 RepID=A0A813W1E6_9BILA|nr:unnamed protein product [Didymodactylos carnosus]CAF0851287.1 unnamed protein product [Didymodactylos carnosus]CAF3533163.1 unnamed protein product [Didymodactylos carnosus]CAF3638918.1 unnamed protein product [Didymodactylos carnosus]
MKTSTMNLSLSGCGFLGVYHIGVICAFKEYAPNILEGKMAGCSAGSLVAACAICDCCLGQMASDALEIALRARSRVLGPLHPTFSIVDIIRNGLRRILPPNAHELCSNRLYISLTRWKDNKNVIISQYNSREELIQALICSSFVPYWSGIIPNKFRGLYYWDGGLTNNNPIIDENTILVSPFAGESDICPRDESGSFYSVDFRGTDISCTQENLYRCTRALFPPELSVLKQICWRGYVDGLKYLQTHNLMITARLTNKSSISSMLGRDYSEPNDEKLLANIGIDDVHQMFAIESEDEDDNSTDSNSLEGDSDHHTQGEFSEFCRQPDPRNELPSPLVAVFNSALNDELRNLGNVVNRSTLLNIWSYIALPIILPIDLTYSVTKKILGFIPYFLPGTSTINQSKSIPLHFFKWLFSNEDDDKKYCYHVVDCVCNDKPSSVASSRYKQRRKMRQSSYNSVISTVPSSKSGSFTNKQGGYHTTNITSTIMNVCSESDLTDVIIDDPDSTSQYGESAVSQHLTHPAEAYQPRPCFPPRLKTSKKKRRGRQRESDTSQQSENDSNQKTYKNKLQQMADLSKRHFNEQGLTTTTLPFFGKDVDNVQEPLPTSTLEKSVVFHETL